MLNCLNTPGNLVGDGTDISVLDRQRARLKWHQEQQQLHHHHHEPFLSGSSSSFFSRALEFPRGSELQDLMSMSRSADHGFGDGWPVAGKFQEVVNGTEFGMNYGISRTASCPPKVAAIVGPAVEKETTAVDGGGRDSSLEKLGLGVGKESFRKRKAGKVHNSKVAAEGEAREKRTKGCTDDRESKITEQNRNISSNNSRNRETSSDTSKDNSKVSQKPNYIHVRARRGQATDSHSLAERVRRERISERMKYLQDLVPGCNKITGKAGMLDEIINYVQSLQRQVEFLSMKLAAVNPRLDFNIDNFLTKEVLPPCAANFPTISISPELANPAYLQYNSMQQAAGSGLEMGANPHELGFPRTVCSPISIPETFVDSSCFTQIQPSSTWDAELQSLYSEDPQGRSTPFLSQPFTGSVEAGNLKVEM